jgi:hypothetical protein
MGDGNRRRRAGVWVAGVAVIAAIAATYQLTRPPALVWWTSPPIDKASRRVAVLIPAGWEEVESQSDIGIPDNTRAFYWAPSKDRIPEILRKLLRRRPSGMGREVVFYAVSDPLQKAVRITPIHSEQGSSVTANGYESHRAFLSGEGTSAGVIYERSDRDIYETTHTAICNSLRIE